MQLQQVLSLADVLSGFEVHPIAANVRRGGTKQQVQGMQLVLQHIKSRALKKRRPTESAPSKDSARVLGETTPTEGADPAKRRKLEEPASLPLEVAKRTVPPSIVDV